MNKKLDYEGASKKKGAAEESNAQEVKNLENDIPVDEVAGASRMGFTQNFGAARQNSYAKGAARVASIMNFGASKKKGAADETGKQHSHEASSTSSSAPSLTSAPSTTSSSAVIASLGVKAPKAEDFGGPIPKVPTLTGNSYTPPKSSQDVADTSERGREFYGEQMDLEGGVQTGMDYNQRDVNLGRNARFHYDLEGGVNAGDNATRLTADKEAKYDLFFGGTSGHTSPGGKYTDVGTDPDNNKAIVENYKSGMPFKPGLKNKNMGF